MTFEEFGLSENVMRGLDAMNFKEATPVQEQTIPVILHNRNFSYLFQQAKISTKNQEKKKITLFINRASNSYMDVPKENPTMTIVSNRRIQFLPTPLYRYQNHTDSSRPRNTHLPPQEKHRY
jgi:hypothetical protein